METLTGAYLLGKGKVVASLTGSGINGNVAQFIAGLTQPKSLP